MNLVKSIYTPIKKLLAQLAGHDAGQGAELIGTGDGWLNAAASLNARMQRVALYADLKAIAPAAALLAPSASVMGRTAVPDGGFGIFDWIAGNQSANVAADPESGVWVTATLDPSGLVGAWRRRIAGAILIEQFGAKADGSSLDTVAIQAAINFISSAANQGAVGNILLPKGTIVFGDTITINTTVNIIGAGRDSTILKFANLTAGKTGIKLVRGSAKSTLKNFSYQDGTFGTSRGIELYDLTTGVGSPVWKNLFEHIELSGFAESHAYTSDNPLNGAHHAQCSENLWLHCRFVNNKRMVLNQNCQAFNNIYRDCDGENFDGTYYGTPITDTNFEFVRDEAGGGIKIIGGSWIGRGQLFTWKYPAGAVGLFNGGSFRGRGMRMECRTGHNGVIVNEDIHGNNGSLVMYLKLKDIDVVTFNQNLDLIAFGGRFGGCIDNVNAVGGTGRLTIRQYPTIGRSANLTTGSQGGLDVYNCGTLLYEKAASSPYGGGFNADYTMRVTFHDQGTGSTNATFSTDADGWISLNGIGGDIQQLGMRLGTMQAPSRLVLNSDVTTSGLAGGSDWKVILPKYGRPLKLFAFKHPQQFAVDTGYQMYLAKDKANWVNPAAFDYTTDAVLVAAMPSTLNKAGWFSADVQLTSNVLGNILQSGFGSWTEGRIFFKKITGNPFPGFVGVEYA